MVAAAALAVLGAGSAQANENLYVVVAASSPIKTANNQEVLALFTGRSRTLGASAVATPLDQQRDGATRAAFYQALTGKDVARINSYWARLHFTGQVQPPQALSDDESVLRRVRSDAMTVGYVSREPTDPSVRVLLRLP